MSKEFLRQLPLFAGLSDEDLDRLYEMAEPVEIRAGAVLIEEGSPGDSAYVALKGTFEVTHRTGEQEVVIAGCGPGDIIGEISLLEGAPRSATIRALNDGSLLKISKDAFEKLLSWSPAATMSVLRTVTTRLRNSEAMLRQSEKMASLGTLSAGLAHELNNPAAAVRRSAGQLRESLAEWHRLTAELDALNLDARQSEVVNRLRMEIPAHAAAPGTLDPLERSDREDGLQSWLDDHGVAQAWELAPALVGLGWTVDDVDRFAATFSRDQVALFVGWLGTGCTVYTLLDEVIQGADRISEIVKAVKSYSYLDQAPVQLVDVHEGLENTLVILRHKLKQGVTIKRDYADKLPRIEAYASELNQVWTNIIDNAIDATLGPALRSGASADVRGHAEITIRTYTRSDEVVVEITDNGPGIPPDVQSRIFDAFFTTKPQGVGTGLGLHITYNIVVHQHHGQIRVQSRPGQTTFQVILPLALQKPTTS